MSDEHYTKVMPKRIPPCEDCGGRYWEWRDEYMRFRCAVCRHEFEKRYWMTFDAPPVLHGVIYYR